MKRSQSVAGLLLGGAVTFLALSLTWIRASYDSDLGPQSIEISGLSAAPGAGAAVAVMVCASLVLALAGPVMQRVCLVTVVIAASLGGWATVGALRDSVAPVRQYLRTQAGAPQLSEQPVLGWAAYLALSLFLVNAVWALFLMIGQRRWALARSRYERTPREPNSADGQEVSDAVRARSDWDRLSAGVDPSVPEVDPRRGDTKSTLD